MTRLLLEVDGVVVVVFLFQSTYQRFYRLLKHKILTLNMRKASGCRYYLHLGPYQWFHYILHLPEASRCQQPVVLFSRQYNLSQQWYHLPEVRERPVEFQLD